jgi:hypothetical protein
LVGATTSVHMVVFFGHWVSTGLGVHIVGAGSSGQTVGCGFGHSVGICGI